MGTPNAQPNVAVWLFAAVLKTAIRAGGQVVSGRRYYSPELGRWMNRDPIGERGGVNLYLFCLNTAISSSDPVGKQVQESMLFSAPYGHPREAAVAAIKYIFPWVCREIGEGKRALNGEASGRIFYDIGTCKFYYTRAMVVPCSKNEPGRVPPGALDAGVYHIHANGAWSSSDWGMVKPTTWLYFAQGRGKESMSSILARFPGSTKPPEKLGQVSNEDVWRDGQEMPDFSVPPMPGAAMNRRFGNSKVVNQIYVKPTAETTVYKADGELKDNLPCGKNSP